MFRRLTTRIFLVVAFAVMCFLGAARDSGAAAQPGDKELFLVAQKAFEDGFYDVTIRYIQQLQQQYPQTDRRVESDLLLGQCYFFKGQYLKAYDIFHQLLGEPQFKDATLFWMGETYLKGGDYHQAEEQYSQVIRLYSDSMYTPQAYYSLGWVYFDQNQMEKARETFTELIRRFPTHQLAEEAQYKIGEIAFQRRQYQDSIKYFSDYISQYPQSTRHGEAYFYMGESAYYLEDFLTAVTYYAKAAEMAYDQKLVIMAKVSLGWSYMKLEKLKLARQYFDEAYALAKDKNMLSDDVLLGRASVYMETKEYNQALEAYEELISAFPASKKLGEAYLGQANIFYLKEDYGNAVRSYQSLVDKFAVTSPSPSDKEHQEISEKAYFGLAWSYLKMGRMDDSIRNFETIKNTTANKTVKISALTQIGDAYQDVGEMNKAIEVYDGILRDYPESPYTDYVQYRQGIALLKAEKIDAATLSFQTLKANFPKSKYLNDADYYLALAYFKKGDWAATRDQAGQFMARATEDNPFLAEAHYILALAAFNLKDYAGALKTFQAIVKNYPSETAMIRNVEMGMAKSYYKTGDEKEALKRFTALVDKYPGTPVAQDALIWLGDHSLESAEYDTAIQYYERFIADFQGSSRLGLVFYELGQAHQAKGEYDQAVSAYKKIDNSGDAALYAKARLALADIFSKELDPGLALSTYQNIIATSPEFQRDAYVKMAAVYRKNRDYAKALEAYQNALSARKGLEDINEAELQFDIADINELLNNREKAVEEYLKLSYLYPKETRWVVKAYLAAARIFEDDEKWTEARTTYEKVVGLKIDESKFAQERLDWINEHIFNKNER